MSYRFKELSTVFRAGSGERSCAGGFSNRKILFAREGFVKYSWLAVLFLVAAFSSAYTPLPSNRAVVNFNADWKFIRSDQPQAYTVAFVDATWQDVGLPHTYNETDIFDQFETGANANGDSGWGGVTWYRKTFSVDAKYQGRMVYLEIVAARSIADVWINGTKVGDTYYSGFSSFAVDLTPYLNFGGTQKNVVAIKVDDTENGGYDAETVIPGNNSRWHPVWGGIWSNVRLHITDKLHVTLPLYSFLQTEGTYIGCPTTSTFRMTTQVKNDYATSQACQLTTEIVDAAGTVAVTVPVATQTIAAGALYKFDQSGAIPSPHLWSPSDPYLYTAYSTLRMGGAVVDVYKTTFGVRTVEWNKTSKMFTINGKQLLLKGWGQKPTNEYASLGPAVPDWLHARDIQLQKDGGGNIVRWGHCAALPAALDAGDKIGYLQWQANLSGEADYTGDMYTRKMIVYRDVLIRDRNHPSIVLWEGNNRPGVLNSGHTKAWRDLADQWDWIVHRPFAVRRPTYSDPTDCNYVDLSIDTDNENKYCLTLPQLEGEFYRPEPPRRYWDEESPPGAHPYAGTIAAGKYGRTQRTAMQEIVAEWDPISKRGGGVKWHFSDATTLGRVPSEVCRCTGSLDGMHVPKDIYYGLKAIWRDDPQVHIMGHWNYTGAHTVDVYTNCEQVELFVNTTSQGVKTPALGRCSWPNVAFQAGTLRAAAKIGGTVRAGDTIQTSGAADHIALSAITNPAGMKADRSDVALVDATVVDANGIVCPTAANPITFAVSGPGSYRGGYNSYIEGTPGKTTLNAEAGLIRVGIRSINQAGTVTVTATSGTLKQGTVSFTTIPDNTIVGIRDFYAGESGKPYMANGIVNVFQKNRGSLVVSYSLNKSSPVTLSILQLNGKTIRSFSIGKGMAGVNDFTIPLTERFSVTQGFYLVKMSVPQGGENFSRVVVMR
jgi:beta-galactosidase